jgi:hypothetical protein
LEQHIDHDHRLGGSEVRGDSDTPGGGAPPDPPRKPDREWLGESLRALLEGYAQEPLPDEFKSLLDKLETESKDSKTAEGDDGAGSSGEGGAPTA